jgi:ATP-dependent helicase/nuclease subunit A
MTANIRIIPAGAGSGKTYRITHQLIDWVEQGLVRPDRILAVTFTEAAAGELRSRIRSALLTANRVEDAIALERSYVSTIHSLGLGIQTDHAFAAGVSPAPRHLSEAEQELLIRQEISTCAALDGVKANLGRFGYQDRFFGAASSAEDAFRAHLLSIISLLRGLGNSAGLASLADDACAAIRRSYGHVSNSPTAFEAALVHAAAAFLEDYPSGGAQFPGADKTKAARDDFRKQTALIRKAANVANVRSDWKLWQSLRNLRTKAQGARIPEDFVARAEAVMQAADGILKHPGALNDACNHLTALVHGAQEVLQTYQARKKTAGLIDFSDMVAGAENLLRTRPDIRDAVLHEIDCVIIDEFQDTNPVQFALLWHLASAAPRAIFVGDVKQSIMGFQGADPALSAALEQQFAEQVEPLEMNWRSDPRIMGFVNALSAGLFGLAYTALAPQRAETGETALEILRVSQGRRSGKSRPEQHVAARVFRLLDRKEKVIDRDSNQRRAIRPGDIAILCRTHSHAENYADALRRLGLPVRIGEEGWLGSIPMQAALAALSLVADPDDTHAALSLLTLGPEAVLLQHAMVALTDGEILDHPSLAPLRDLAGPARWQGVDTLVPEILDLAGLYDWVQGLDEPRKLRADLLRLEHEAGEFLSAHRDMRAAAGFYGASLAVFIGWIHARRDERDFDKRPDVGGATAEGIEVVTWHASKGREWNVVVVADLDGTVREKPGATRACFSDYADLGNILNEATLSHVPRFDIPEKQDVFLDFAQPRVEDEARRLIYVALTRARDRLILEWPDFKLDKTDDETVTCAGMMRDAGMSVAAGAIVIADAKIPARTISSGDERPPEFEREASEPQPPVALRYGTLERLKPGPRKVWRTTPSSLEGESGDVPPDLRHVDLGVLLPDSGISDVDAAGRGTRLHLAMRVLLGRPEAADRLARATGFDAATLSALEKQAATLASALAEMGYETLHCELPLQIAEDDGSQTNAIIDCLAEGADTFCILDHKSGPAPDPDARFNDYRGQLAAYAGAVRAIFPEKPVRHIVVNWLDEGRLSVLDLLQP